MKYIEMLIVSLFASLFGCFATLGVTNEDCVFPAIAMFMAWLALLIFTIFDNF